MPTLTHVLERTLRLLHPFMPFITEEIWQTLLERLPNEGDQAESIMVSQFPQADSGLQDSEAEGEITLVMQAIRAVRNTRAQLQIPANEYLEAIVEANGLQKTIEEESELIRNLSRVDPLKIVTGDAGSEGPIKGITLVVDPLVVRLPLEGVVDIAVEAERIRGELAECQSNLDRVGKLVSNPNFRAKAKPEVVETEEERLKSLEERQQRLNEILEQLEA
jgi:valyl-tRNA synthetase